MFDLSVYEKIGEAETDADLSVGEQEVEAALRQAFVGPAGEGASDLLKAEAEAFARFRGAPDGGVNAPRAASCSPSLFVANDGSVYPCQALELPEFRLGNVASGDSLQAAFNATPFSELRRTMSRDDIEGCRSCDLRYACMSHCHGAAFKKTGRTTAQLSDGVSCKRRLARALWADVRVNRARRRATVPV
jgi:radical SAM protein with 4Fe4S-binding SPASM domain